MCNLYSVTKPQAAIRDLAKAVVDHAGNMPSLPDIFPIGRAPVVRTMSDCQRDDAMGLPAAAKPHAP